MEREAASGEGEKEGRRWGWRGERVAVVGMVGGEGRTGKGGGGRKL